MSYTQKLVINACKNRHLFQYGLADYTEYIQIIKIKLDKRRTIGVKLNIQSKFMCLPYNAARHAQNFDHFSIEGKKLSIEIFVGRRMAWELDKN